MTSQRVKSLILAFLMALTLVARLSPPPSRKRRRARSRRRERRA
jgi:hypothetical protein